MTIIFKEDDWRIELTYDTEDEVYREKGTDFFRVDLEFLIRVAQGYETDVEII